MKRYAVYALDAWGNAKDGYEVNDYYQQAIYIESDDFPESKKIIAILKKAGLLKKRCRFGTQDWGIEVFIEYKGLPLFSIKETLDSVANRFIDKNLRPIYASVYRIHPSRIVKIQ